MATAMAEVTVVTASDLLQKWQGRRRLTWRVIEAFPEDKLFEFSMSGMKGLGQMKEKRISCFWKLLLTALLFVAFAHLTEAQNVESLSANLSTIPISFYGSITRTASASAELRHSWKLSSAERRSSQAGWGGFGRRRESEVPLL
jgi:hypothetical protein